MYWYDFLVSGPGWQRPLERQTKPGPQHGDTAWSGKQGPPLDCMPSGKKQSLESCLLLVPWAEASVDKDNSVANGHGHGAIHMAEPGEIRSYRSEKLPVGW